MKNEKPEETGKKKMPNGGRVLQIGKEYDCRKDLKFETSTWGVRNALRVPGGSVIIIIIIIICTRRAGKLARARSRLYRGQILQQNMRLKALAEIYTTHSFALL